MEKQPSFDRIVGGTTDEKEKSAKRFEASYDRTLPLKVQEVLVERTPKEQEMIEHATAYVNKIAASYGGTRTVDAHRVYLLSENGVAEIRQRGKLGYCEPETQNIMVDRRESPVLMGEVVAHEAFHLSGFQSAQISHAGTPEIYRTGIAMQDRKSLKPMQDASHEFDTDISQKNTKNVMYFNAVNEAIVSTLAHRFVESEVVHNPTYTEELFRTKAIIKWMSATAHYIQPYTQNYENFVALIENILILPNNKELFDTLYAPEIDTLTKIQSFNAYFEKLNKTETVQKERVRERAQLATIIHDTVEASHGSIESEDALFDLFAQAHFTGNYLPLARTIEGVLGKGSFRQIAITTARVTPRMQK